MLWSSPGGSYPTPTRPPLSRLKFPPPAGFLLCVNARLVLQAMQNATSLWESTGTQCFIREAYMKVLLHHTATEDYNT